MYRSSQSTGDAVMSNKRRKVLQSGKSVMVAISHAANRCDELLKDSTVTETEEDVDNVLQNIKNSCAILREWTTEEGNVLPTMYFNEELFKCNERLLIAGVTSEEYFAGYISIRKCAS